MMNIYKQIVRVYFNLAYELFRINKLSTEDVKYS